MAGGRAMAAVVALGVACASAKTVPATTAAYDERACRPGYDHFGFCETGQPKAVRLAALVDAIRDEEIPALLTAREGGGGSPGPPGNISRLGLPAYDWGLNCVHGVQSSCVEANGTTYCPTSFPNPVNLGASFNRSMWLQMGKIMGREARALFVAGAKESGPTSGRPHIGLDCWSPNINLNHDPRWGRNQEVPSEDPLVNGAYGKAVTLGLERAEGTSYKQGVSTIKHWAAYNLEDADGKTRFDFDAKVDNSTLTSAYLPAFKDSIVNGKASGVMCSYNALNGVPACASQLLRQVLREQWNFTGYVTSDTGAVKNMLKKHHYVTTEAEATIVALAAETDIDSGKIYHDALLPSLQSGKLPRALVESALNHTLGLLFDMGLFDPVDTQPLWHIPLAEIGQAASQATSLQAAHESMVLLKNDKDTLPLATGQRVAVVGPHAQSREQLVGNYLGQLCADDTFNCVQNFASAMTDANVKGTVTAVEGCTVTGTSTAGFADALAAVDEADVVVLAIGLSQSVEAESHDRTAIDLPGVQAKFAAEVTGRAHAKGAKVVAVLVNGGMVSLGDLAQGFDAIVEAFYPGIYGARAVADTLFGTNERLGAKMPYTVYPASYASAIKLSEMSFNRAGTPGRSYRFYTGEAEFEFGFGLAYTTFAVELACEAGAVSCDDPGKAVRCAATVTNTGRRTGDNVVMLHRVGGEVGTGLPVKKQLLDFGRVHLAAGEKATVRMSVTSDAFLDVTAGGDHVCRAGRRQVVVSDGTSHVAADIDVQSTGPAPVVAFRYPDSPPRKQ